MGGVSRLGLLLVAATATGCLCPELKTGARVLRRVDGELQLRVQARMSAELVTERSRIRSSAPRIV
jgi:hypothetical protein